MANIKNGLGPDHIANSTMIDADNDDLSGLPSSGQPLSFFGGGRPDLAPGVPGPMGSTYTCKSPDTNFGARVWRKTGAADTNWVCIEGDTGYCKALVGSTPYNGWSIAPGNMVTGNILFRRINATVQVSFSINNGGHVNWQQGHSLGSPGWLNPSSTISGFLVEPGGTAPLQHIELLGGASANNIWYFAGTAASIPGCGHVTYQVANPQLWPSGSALEPAMTREELKELIEEEADPEQLQQLKDQLEQLQSNETRD